MVAVLAERLGINTAEADNLIGELAVDAQLELIEQIWGSVDLEISESSAKGEHASAASAG